LPRRGAGGQARSDDARVWAGASGRRADGIFRSAVGPADPLRHAASKFPA